MRGHNSAPQPLVPATAGDYIHQVKQAVWSYLDLTVPRWGGVAAPLRPASELPVGGPVRPVRVSLLCRRGRSVVCVVFAWCRKGKGGHIRSFAECRLPGSITPEPTVVGPKGSTGSLRLPIQNHSLIERRCTEWAEFQVLVLTALSF